MTPLKILPNCDMVLASSQWTLPHLRVLCMYMPSYFVGWTNLCIVNFLIGKSLLESWGTTSRLTATLNLSLIYLKLLLHVL